MSEFQEFKDLYINLQRLQNNLEDNERKTSENSKEIITEFNNLKKEITELKNEIIKEKQDATIVVKQINKRSIQNRLGDVAIGGLIASIVVITVIFYLTTWLSLDSIEKYNLAKNFKELNEKSAEEFKALKEYKELALFLKKRDVSYYDLTKFEDNRCNIIIPKKYIDNSKYPNTKNKDVCIIFKK